MEPRADWLAWSLQLGAGLLVGGGGGLFLAGRLARFHLISRDQMFWVIAGVALCCGAFTSFHGDRAWMPPSPFAPPEPVRTQKSRATSLVIGMAGAALVLLPVILSALAPASPARRSSASGFNFFLLLAAALPGFLIVHASRTGSGIGRLGTVDRDETPLAFWFYVLVNASALLCILSAMRR